MSSSIQDGELNVYSVSHVQSLRKRKSTTYVHVEDCASAVDYSTVLGSDDAVDSPPTNVRYNEHSPSPTWKNRRQLVSITLRSKLEVNRSVRRRL